MQLTLKSKNSWLNFNSCMVNDPIVKQINRSKLAKGRFTVSI